MAEITEQIVREAPEIEKIKLGLLQSAKALPAPNLPAYQVAGLTPEQLDALQRGVSGIGSYLPFMQAAQTATTAGAGMLGQGADILTGADTRAQFDAARQAMTQAGTPISQLDELAFAAGQGAPLLGGAATDVDLAQAMAQQYAQANLGPAQNLMLQSIQQAQGAGPQFGAAQQRLLSGAGLGETAAERARQAALTTNLAPIEQRMLQSVQQAQAAGPQFGAAQQRLLSGAGLGETAAERARQAALETNLAPIEQRMLAAGQRAGAAGPQFGAAQQRIGAGVGAGYQAATAAQQAAQQPGFGAAEATLGRGIAALGGAAKGFTPSDVQAFMNPYQQQVIDESLRQINRQGDIARQNLQAQAVRAGAFGGSREGIQRAELERGLAEQRNAAITGALAQGYQSSAQQAQEAFEQQQQRQLAQAQGFQGAAGQGGSLAAQRAGLGQQAAQQLAQAGGMEMQAGSQLGSLEAQRAQQALATEQFRGGLEQQLAAQRFQQAGLGQQAAQQLAQAGQLGLQAGSQLGSLEAQRAQQALAAAQYGGNINQQLAAQRFQQAGLGQQAAQQLAQAGQMGMQAGSQLGSLEAQRAQQALAAAQYGGNIGQQLAAQGLQQAGLGQGAAGLYGNLAQQQAALAGQYGDLAARQASILGQQAQLGQAQAAGLGSLAQGQFGVGSQLAAGLGSLGTQLGAVGLQQGQLGEASQRLGQQDVSFLYGLGQQQQTQKQREVDALRATQLQTAYQPYQQLAFLSDIYKGAPSTQMALTTQAAPAPSPFQQVAGLGTGLLATGAAINQAGRIF
jgi:hypothetical protein